MRPLSKACVAGALTILLVVPGAAAGAKQGEVKFAELVQKESAEPGAPRTRLKLFTSGIHSRNGGSVLATFRNAEADARQRRAQAARFAVWTVTSEKGNGRRLITAIRRTIANDEKAQCEAILFGRGGGGAPFVFTLRDLNDRVRAERYVIE